VESSATASGDRATDTSLALRVIVDREQLGKSADRHLF
jgi:hypothetical protein